MKFVTLDFETAQYGPESACAAGLVRFENGCRTGSYYSLIRPPSLYIRPDFTAIHGIRTEDVESAPRFSDIWETGILPFIGGLPVAAHNARFDMRVLRAVLEYYGLGIPRIRYFCTLEIARKLWPELPSRALTKLAEHFGIEYEAHNALADADTCGLVALRAAKQAQAACVKTLLKKSGVSLHRF
ncbi:MAG: 3'-5' exonuclease [Spirochaetaceae bacterium]|jgi:DNA polymerase-3 subunit epsilon|nr:3'-5' exonuclease [Spirochaetaceae bacterium]